MKINRVNTGFGEIAALCTWGIVFGITLYWLPNASEEIKSISWLIVTLFLVYMACFWLIVRSNVIDEAKRLFYVIYLTQLVCAYGLMILIPVDYLSILTIIWVAVLPHVTRLKWSLLITLAVLVTWFSLRYFRWEISSVSNVIFPALLYGSFHVFAILMNFETVKAERANEEAQRLNKELQATQNLLAQASRQNERTRIARDLHDLLGHHLTALIINLQVAGRISDGEAKDRIEQCHSLAKLLLSDVREAVSALRENQNLEFPKMLELMCEKLPNLTVHRKIDADLSLEDMVIAKALLSCIQESLTNSLRHSHASDFWIEINHIEEKLILDMHDNGNVIGGIKIGNGIKGMRERIEELSGSFEFSVDKQVLKIRIEVPLNSYKDKYEQG